MANKPKYMRKVAEDAAERLLPHVDAPDFSLRVRQEAEHILYTERHLRRLVAARRQDHEEADDATNTDDAMLDAITAVFLTCGNLAAAHRMLASAGAPVPSVRSFRRHMVRRMGTAMLAYARGGSAAFRNKQVFLTRQPTHRMHSVLLDHTELPIWVVPRGHKIAQKPWITAVMDAETRYVLSWVVTFGRPNSEQVRAALIQAILMRTAPDRQTVVGGRPVRAVWDRGLEFLSDMITESSMRLGFIPVALPAYSPHLKGALERFWRFLKTDLLPPLPGYSEGPVDLRGNSAIATAAFGEDAFLIKLADWMDGYVAGHVISTTGMTPLQAWQADATPLEEIPAEQLWQDFLISKPTKVSKMGVRFDGVDYVAPEVMGKVGRTVEVRHLPHDRSFIEVFCDSEHLGTAYPSHLLTVDDSQAVIDQRQAERRAAMQRFTVANTLRRSSPDTVRLSKDAKGRQHVVEPPAADLLSGGNAAYERLITKSDDPNRLF